jgi:hypothetical protein
MPMEKTFDPKEAEARISAKWIATNAFAAGANAKPGHPAFSVMIPPPQAKRSRAMLRDFNAKSQAFARLRFTIQSNMIPPRTLTPTPISPYIITLKPHVLLACKPPSRSSKMFGLATA